MSDSANEANEAMLEDGRRRVAIARMARYEGEEEAAWAVRKAAEEAAERERQEAWRKRLREQIQALEAPSNAVRPEPPPSSAPPSASTAPTAYAPPVVHVPKPAEGTPETPTATKESPQTSKDDASEEAAPESVAAPVTELITAPASAPTPNTLDTTTTTTTTTDLTTPVTAAETKSAASSTAETDTASTAAPTIALETVATSDAALGSPAVGTPNAASAASSSSAADTTRDTAPPANSAPRAIDLAPTAAQPQLVPIATMSDVADESGTMSSNTVQDPPFNDAAPLSILPPTERWDDSALRTPPAPTPCDLKIINEKNTFETDISRVRDEFKDTLARDLQYVIKSSELGVWRAALWALKGTEHVAKFFGAGRRGSERKAEEKRAGSCLNAYGSADSVVRWPSASRHADWASDPPQTAPTASRHELLAPGRSRDTSLGRASPWPSDLAATVPTPPPTPIHIHPASEATDASSLRSRWVAGEPEPIFPTQTDTATPPTGLPSGPGPTHLTAPSPWPYAPHSYASANPSPQTGPINTFPNGHGHASSYRSYAPQSFRPRFPPRYAPPWYPPRQVPAWPSHPAHWTSLPSPPQSPPQSLEPSARRTLSRLWPFRRRERSQTPHPAIGNFSHDDPVHYARLMRDVPETLGALSEAWHAARRLYGDVRSTRAGAWLGSHGSHRRRYQRSHAYGPSSSRSANGFDHKSAGDWLQLLTSHRGAFEAARQALREKKASRTGQASRRRY
ncbi:hypothetical protein Q5752_004623 [Cryptotrichosporon argae]